MYVKQIHRLETILSVFLDLDHEWFARKNTRRHLSVKALGQVSILPEKIVESIARHAKVPPDILQGILDH